MPAENIEFTLEIPVLSVRDVAVSNWIVHYILPLLERLGRECIWRAEQMNVIRHDNVPADSPEICRLPCLDDQSRCFVVRSRGLR